MTPRSQPATAPAKDPENAPQAVLTEHTDDAWGGYETHWFCNPPPDSMAFRAVREEWNDDFTIRRIYEIEEL